MKAGRAPPFRGSSEAPRLPAKDALELQLREGIRKISGLDLSSSQIETLLTYCALVERWNRSCGLVGARTLPEIVPRHILDALSLSRSLPSHAHRILDLGTGAGLPGLPLAVAHPDRWFTLLDRSRKKTRFVRQAKLELDLSNVEVVTEEAERYEADPFDCVMARAVGSLSEMVRGAAHLVAPDGIFLFPKGEDIESELRELPAGWAPEIGRGKDPGRTVVALHPLYVDAEEP